MKRRAMSVFFSPASTLAQIAARTSGERFSFLFRVPVISVPRSYGSDILKRCGKELKIAVNFMDVDDLSFEVECCKTLYNYLYNITTVLSILSFYV